MLEIDKDSIENFENTKDYSNITSISRIHCDNISYCEFFSNFMVKNIPLILTSVSNDWKCNNWTILDEFGEKSINISQIRCEIPNIEVPVANCSKQYFNSHEKSVMNFYDFLDYWKLDCKDDLLYLKDWHLRKELPDYEYYKVPQFFASDWLNETICDDNLDDYKFVYMGPKDTWTSFHCDVFSSFSWSTNIVGRKKWLLLIPGEENKLKDKFGNFPFSISEKILEEKNVKFFAVTQEAGEAIFVPSGWYHQVHNILDTISINHNWFNGTQINLTWCALENNLQAVEKEIDDCRDMENFEEQCQIILKASFGMNINDFFKILHKIVHKTKNKTRYFEGFVYGENHLIFDLMSIDRVLKNMLKSSFVKDENIIKEINLLRTEIENCDVGGISG